MRIDTNKGKVILRVTFSGILFSLFIKLDSIFSIADTLADRGWPLLSILLMIVIIRMVFAGMVVLLVLPPILGFGNRRKWLPGYLMIDQKIVVMGLLSFAIFCILAAGISLTMGIFRGDLSTVFAFPDLRPDPDVIGWGYFLLALIPAVWEELAFRGLIQSKLQQGFSTRVSIFLSALFFALFHLSNMINQPPSQVIPGVIMAFLFGIGWGFMTVKARSVVPAMISHYLVDSMGQIFLGVASTDPALAAGFFMLLTLLFPFFNILLAKLLYQGSRGALTVSS